MDRLWVDDEGRTRKCARWEAGTVTERGEGRKETGIDGERKKKARRAAKKEARGERRREKSDRDGENVSLGSDPLHE